VLAGAAVVAPVRAKPAATGPNNNEVKPRCASRICLRRRREEAGRKAGAKAWSEAEQRAAQENAERATGSNSAPPQPVVPAAQVTRSRLPLAGKVGAATVSSPALIALFAVPYAAAYAGLCKQGRTIACPASLQQPVPYRRHMEGRLLPMPHLELSDVSVGEPDRYRQQAMRK